MLTKDSTVCATGLAAAQLPAPWERERRQPAECCYLLADLSPPLPACHQSGSPDRVLYRWCNMECAVDETKKEFVTHTDTGLQFKSFVKKGDCTLVF